MIGSSSVSKTPGVPNRSPTAESQRRRDGGHPTGQDDAAPRHPRDGGPTGQDSRPSPPLSGPRTAESPDARRRGRPTVDLTTAALVAAALGIGVCCGVGGERYREYRRFQRMKEQVERRIDAEEEAEAGRPGSA